jgi:hypothetical protein
MIYLIQYDRRRGALVAIEEFSPQQRLQAEQRRLDLELSLLSKKVTYEVVLIEASSQAELRKTHRRYFEDLKEIFATV